MFLPGILKVQKLSFLTVPMRASNGKGDYHNSVFSGAAERREKKTVKLDFETIL